MRIALISTPFVRVPPPSYGGTELIVAELAEGLTAAGHHVTLFATGDSRSCAAHVPIHLGGRGHWRDEGYFAGEREWRLRLPGVYAIGEVGGEPKARFLGGACALLFPICWEEPFGLVMIEAMLCGTPVLAF